MTERTMREKIEAWESGAIVPAPAVPDDVAGNLADYDAGLLNDFGGGDVDWWQDYLRAEIGRANDFWRVQAEAQAAELAAYRAVPAPAVPDDVATWRQRADGFAKSNQMLRCDLTEAQATIEAQAAELARLREALQPFASAWRIAQASGLTSMVQLGSLARNEVAAVAFMKAAAIQPTGDA